MKRPSKKLILVLILILALVGGAGYVQYQRNSAETARLAQVERDKAAQAAKAEAERRRQAAQQQEPPTPQPIPVFNNQLFSVDDPNSIWVVVNKQRALQPKEHVPIDLVAPDIPLRYTSAASEMKLRREAATALETMASAAKKDGATLMLASGYRSYNTQVAVYNNEVKRYGQAVADTQSARPGHSEHQTGLGVDLEPSTRQCEIADCFADTVEGKWLAANSGKYGFILRYTADKTSVTGYRAESWHFRYVGVALAAEMQKQGILTLEEFFGLPAAPGY